MKDASEILNASDVNTFKSITHGDQTELFGKLKEMKFFELAVPERENLISFLGVAEQDLAKDYLFHVLDNELPYPVDDEKAKVLFADDRIKTLKEQMMMELQEDDEATETTEA